MNKINMISRCFSHVESSCHNYSPKLFKWDFETKNSKISVYIDFDLTIALNDKDDKIKFLWLLESPEFNGGAIEIVKNNIKLIEDTFEAVFTYSDELSSLSNKFHKVFTTNSWIKQPKVYDKSKLISMITSNKVWVEQQKYRVDFAEKNKSIIDIYGKGFKDIEDKEEGLQDYMFSVCIENITYDSYFTEKILDCFATGTIPIYRGSKKILDYYDGNGIIFLDDLSDLSDLTPELYFSKIESVNRNFKTLNEYILIDDFIYRNFLSKYL
jgi:hypothetical protein